MTARSSGVAGSMVRAAARVLSCEETKPEKMDADRWFPR